MKRPDIGDDGVDCFSFPLELSMYGQTLPFHDFYFSGRMSHCGMN